MARSVLSKWKSAAMVAAMLTLPAVALAQATPPPPTPPQSAPPPATPPQAAPAEPAPAQPMPAGGGRVFNPDMSVIANFLATGGKNPNNPAPSMQLTEAEIGLQAVVDPYARADFFISVGPEGASVEEGYITFTTLPAGLLMKVGKMRAQFGKVNAQHTHSLPYADRPLVTENLVGGEDGLSDAGISVSKLFATRALYVEAIGEAYAGQNNVFQSPERSKINYVGRVRAYRDLTEGTNLDVGGSIAFGPTNVGLDNNKTLYGIDATFRYRPLRRAIYKRFQARTELIWSKQDIGTTRGVQETAFGTYGLAEYQFARRWYAGARVDRAGHTLDGSLKDSGVSGFLTFWPSEFSEVRWQFRHTSYADGVKGNEILVQFNFSIGAHGAHVF
jgi:hypothetical protein